MLKLIAATALLSVGVPVAAPAQQAQHDIHVSYHDLDLRRAGDVKLLNNRLRSAISAVCPDDRTADPVAKLAAQNCYRDKYAEAAALRSAAGAKARGAEVATTR